MLVEDIINGVDHSDEGKRIAAEAVGWLQSHDLLAVNRDTGGSGWLFITRLGYEVLKSDEARDGGIALSLRVIDLIPESIRAVVTQPLLSGDFDLAITAACKAAEVRMRERAGLPTSDFGSRLARKFFAKVEATALQHIERRGDLADEEHLFVGLFGLYRDRAVHEVPHVEDAPYACEIVVIASHLLRIVEAAEIKS